MQSIKKIWQRVGLLLALVVMCASCSRITNITESPWEMVQLPTQSNLQDVAFTGDANHGWLVGSDATIFETTDGGKEWQERKLELDDSRYRFTGISFKDQEGWIVGEPSIMLHTKDGGKNWTRIALSSKLPGNPNTILALGKNQAEMTTSLGAIYRTDDGGKNWKALVQEAVGVVRNINRSANGEYVAVSAKGNFYSTWKPGDEAWTPHNRNSSRRVSSMGFNLDGSLWMLARGGQLQNSSVDNPEEWQKETFPAQKTNWGLLDLAYRTPEEIWISGGSGTLLRSSDAGQTWEQDSLAQTVPSNLYKILFFNSDRGFIIGQRGILLRYQGSNA